MAAELLSPADYYRRERVAEFKSEFYAGEVFAMAGGSVNHSLIKANVVGTMRDALRKKGGGCRTFDSDLRVKIPKTGLRTYPDLSVICGPVETDPDDDAGETATNPTVIAEVMSHHTEPYLHSKRFDHFQTIATLRQYVLVSQEEPKVETFLRGENNTWQYVSVIGLNAVATLASLDVTLPLAEIFMGVTFPPAMSLSMLEKT